jgi:2-keto-3-deoxy-L-rhamnonate aldolase RhmA
MDERQGRQSADRFKCRLISGDAMLGTFMKVPASQNCEVLGLHGFDFVVLDEEHAPWNRDTLDRALLACRAYDIAGLVRVARDDASSVLSALDSGAAGVMVPHVDSAEKARQVVSWARYIGGQRGSGSSRGGEYGGRGEDNYRVSDALATVICMIEDHGALRAAGDIAAIEGVDGLFLGRADLALSLQNAEGPAPTVKEAVELVVAAAQAAGKPALAVVQSLDSDEARWLLDLGLNSLMVASDLGLLRQAASSAIADFRLAVDRRNEGRPMTSGTHA